MARAFSSEEASKDVFVEQTSSVEASECGTVESKCGIGPMSHPFFNSNIKLYSIISILIKLENEFPISSHNPAIVPLLYYRHLHVFSAVALFSVTLGARVL
jgi:hypothetical protein